MKVSKHKKGYLLSSEEFKIVKSLQKNEKVIPMGKRLNEVLKGIEKDLVVSEKGKFYIDKKTKERTFKKPSTPSREIIYLKDDFTREYLNKVAEILANGYNWENFHGFLPNKSVLTFNEQYENIKVEKENTQKIKGVLKIDLSNAFNQISENFVYCFFKYVMDLNKEKAVLLTTASCFNGYLYQGCPFSPLIFNYYIINIVERINNLKHISIISYADDLLIINTRGTFSHKFKRFLYRMLTDYGLKVNKKKSKLCSYASDKYYLGLKLGKGVIRKGQETIKKIKHKTFKYDKCEIKDKDKTLIWSKIIGYEAWLQAPRAFYLKI